MSDLFNTLEFLQRNTREYATYILFISLWTQAIQAQQCNHIDDYTALYHLYYGTDGNNWNNSTNWEITAHPDTVNVNSLDMSTWYGITCQSGRVVELKLNSNGLNGSIPSEIGTLAQLTNLWLDNNSNLSGSIPTEIGNLSQLVNLRLHFNQLSGSIPASIGDLTLLSQLSLNGSNLTGTLPSSIFNLTNLTELNLVGNNLIGSIPVDIGNLINLTYLNLSANQLSGAIPSSISLLSKMTHLNLGFNELSGNIPSNISDLTNLSYLDLSFNQLTGSIPGNIENITKLQRLYLQRNQLSGGIPIGIGNLSMLSYLNLRRNELTGNIPISLGYLDLIAELDLSHNRLSGCYPSTLYNLCELFTNQLDFSNNLGLPGGGDLLGTLCTDGIGECCADPNYAVDTIAPYPIYVPAINITLAADGSGLVFPNLSFFVLNQNIDDCTPDEDLIVTISRDSSFSTNPITLNCQDICAGTVLNFRIADEAGNATECSVPIVVRDKSFPSACPDKRDYSTLVLLYEEVLSGGIWTNKSGWEDGADGTNCDPCTWYGVTCDSEGRVTKLDLQNNNIHGTIPPHIANLSNLEEVYLDDNHLTGNLPSSIGTLSSLSYLSLQNNQMSGELPVEIFNLTNLNLLWLQNNNFSGIIPPQIGNLVNLEFLDLKGNDFTGLIPSELSNLILLSSLTLSNNSLSGPILDIVSSLQNLGTLILNNNSFSGTFPLEFQDLENLTYVKIDNNNFSGNLPEYLGYLQNMKHFDISNNSFRGCIPYTYKTFCAISKSDGNVIRWDNNPNLDNGGNFMDFCSKEIGACPPPIGCNLVRFRVILGTNSTLLLFHFESMDDSHHTNGFIVKTTPSGDTLDYILQLDTAWHRLDLFNINGGGLGSGSFELSELNSNILLQDNIPFDRHVLTQEFPICDAQEFNSTYYVTNTNDSGSGSLRNALNLSSTYFGYDTIIVQTTGVISLDSLDDSNTLLPAMSDITLYGNGITIDANSLGRISNISDDVSIHDVTFKNGSSAFTSGALSIGAQAYGDTAIFNCVLFQGNTANTNNILGGGAMRLGSEGIVKAINSTFSGNKSMHDGGAIYVKEGTLILDQCTFSDNMVAVGREGGAIYNDQGKLYISNTIFANSLPTGVSDIYNTSPSSFRDSKDSKKSGGTLPTIPINDNNLVENCGGDCPEFEFEIDPILGSLTDNGGNTFTHALLPSSVAINDDADSNPSPDGRGYVGNTVRDIGAYEAAAVFPGPCEKIEFLFDTVTMMNMIDYSASEFLGSQQVIKDDSEVLYEANLFIELKQDFTISQGSQLEVVIGDCLEVD